MILIVLNFALSAWSQSAKDMLEREVVIPEKIEKVFSASPPMMALLYALAPEKMIGVNYRFYEIEKRYMLPHVANLPILGSFYSAGNQANLEKVITLKPDIVFMWDIVRKNGLFFEESLEKFNIPLAYIAQNSIQETLEALRVMGVFLKKEERASKLIAHGSYALKRVEESVQNLGDTPRKKVYLAQGNDGLTTECDGNLQSQIIPLVGGINVHQCDKEMQSGVKKNKITLETLYMYDPDVIFVWNREFFKTLDGSSPWRNLRAYKENQIYFSPISPFNWLSRPPSLMRLLGALWMHNILYPNHFEIDINEEIKSFYKLFLHVNLDDNDIKTLLKGE